MGKGIRAMDADTYQIISTTAFSLAAVFFIMAVLFFIKFNIPGLISDLTGRTAKKQIQEIRRQNILENRMKTSSGVYEVNNTQSVRIEASDIRENVSIKRKGTKTVSTEILPSGTKEETAVLSYHGGTEVLAQNMTEDEAAFYGVTEELTNYDEQGITPVKFNIVKSIIIVHSDITAL